MELLLQWSGFLHSALRRFQFVIGRSTKDGGSNKPGGERRFVDIERLKKLSCIHLICISNVLEGKRRCISRIVEWLEWLTA